MKLIKVFGLAALVVVAAMAVIGASSASAAVFCLNNSNPCSEKKTLVHFLSAKGEGKFTSGFVSVECHVGVWVTVLEGGELWLPVDVTITLSNCSGCTGANEVKILNAEMMATGSGNGVLKGNGEAIFKSCPFGVECKYKGEGTEAVLDGSATNALALVTKQVLPKSGGSGLCSSTGEWNATFHGETEADKMTFVEES